MFPTHMDFIFFQSKQKLPSWAHRVTAESRLAKLWNQPAHALIDDVVNAHAKVRVTSGEVAASNLLVLVRSFQRRGQDVTQELLRLAEEPQCAINPEKRAAFARKWAAKLSTKNTVQGCGEKSQCRVA